MKKITSAALALLLILSAMTTLTSCSEKKDDQGNNNINNQQNNSSEPNSTDGNESDDGGANTAPETQRLKPDIPESGNFGGDDITFLYWTISFWRPEKCASRDIYAEGITAEPINDAVYNRNVKIQEAYDVKIGLEIMDHDKICTAITNTATTGDGAYDVVMPRLVEASSLFNKGVLLNVLDIPNIDLSKPWWDQDCADTLTVEGYLPCIASSITICDKEATASMMFSKDLAKANDVEDIYTIVREGRWTMDKLCEIAEMTYRDLDGNGEMNQNDQYGFLGQRDVTESFFYGSGSQFAKKDENGKVSFTFGSERDINVSVDIINMMNQTYFRNNHMREDAEGIKSDELFEQGQGFFLWTRLIDVTRLRACDVDLGIIPIPKYEESQDAYYSMVSRHATALMSVPASISGEKLNQLGIVLEALAAESHYTLIPEYIENALKTKGSRDAESADMVETIISNRIYDPIYFYNIGGWSDTYLVLGDTDNTNLASLTSSKAKIINKQLSNLAEKFASFVEDAKAQ